MSHTPTELPVLTWRAPRPCPSSWRLNISPSTQPASWQISCTEVMVLMALCIIIIFFSCCCYRCHPPESEPIYSFFIDQTFGSLRQDITAMVIVASDGVCAKKTWVMITKAGHFIHVTDRGKICGAGALDFKMKQNSYWIWRRTWYADEQQISLETMPSISRDRLKYIHL